MGAVQSLSGNASAKVEEAIARALKKFDGVQFDNVMRGERDHKFKYEYIAKQHEDEDGFKFPDTRITLMCKTRSCNKECRLKLVQYMVKHVYDIKTSKGFYIQNLENKEMVLVGKRSATGKKKTTRKATSKTRTASSKTRKATKKRVLLKKRK